MAEPDRNGASGCADEVTLPRKGAKSRSRTGLRSTGTKARTHVGYGREPNAELEKKLAEALEQQAATSEVLRVISSSPGNLEPVFETILANATRLCEAKFGTLYLYDGDAFRAVAFHNAPPALSSIVSVDQSVLAQVPVLAAFAALNRWFRSTTLRPSRLYRGRSLVCHRRRTRRLSDIALRPDAQGK